MEGVEGADQSAKPHVQGCRKEDVSKEKQSRPQGIWNKVAGGIIYQYPADVARNLDHKDDIKYVYLSEGL